MTIPIKKVNTDEFTMNYFSFGEGKKAFVILPGLSVQSVMTSAEVIAKAYEIIAKNFTVYVFDRRNELPQSYSVYDMAVDTAQALEALGLKDVYLFGASQGGMIALAITAKHPELVKKLMLGSSSARITDEQYKSIGKWIELAKRKERVTLSLEMGRVLYPENLFNKFKDALASLGESITDEDLERFIVFAEGTKGFDITDKIPVIECPVLSLGAKDDKVLPGAAEELERLFSIKKIFESYLYSGFGHAAFDTAPDYKERLLDFMLKE